MFSLRVYMCSCIRVNDDVELGWRRGVCSERRQVNGRSFLWSLSASLVLAWPRQARGSCGLMSSPMNLFPSGKLLDIRDSSFFTVFLSVMATSARFASSLRRSALSARVAPRTQCLRLAPQVRRITSATSEPHQPDSKGGLDGPAPAKTIKFTSESYVTIAGNNRIN